MDSPLLSTSPHNHPERRRAPRYNMALDVAFGPNDETHIRHADRLHRTVTTNLSIGGCCLYSDVVYPVGSELICILSLPEREKPLSIIGTVAWFQKIDNDAHGYKIGMEFTRISPQDKEALQEFLKQPPCAKGSPAGKKLLLVDDDKELRLALKLRFESLGFEVVTAGDGLEGLAKGRQERPNAIVLDLMLPKLNGYEVCRLLKFDQKFSHIPVLLLTARSRSEDVEMGKLVGADAFVTKPFDGTDLIAKVESLIGVGRA